jgi:hypothetical protein
MYIYISKAKSISGLLILLTALTRPDEVTYGAAMGATARGTQWLKAEKCWVFVVSMGIAGPQIGGTVVLL